MSKILTQILLLSVIHLNKASARSPSEILSTPYTLTHYEQQQGSKSQAEFANLFLHLNPKLIDSIHHTAEKIRQQIPAKNFTYQIKFVDLLYPNAFALADGTIFITTGMIIALENNHQMAAIIAHEMAHILARHYYSIDKLKKKNDWEFDGYYDLEESTREDKMPTIKLMQQSRQSQSNEWEADKLGLHLLIKSGFNPYAQVEILNKINEFEKYIEKNSHENEEKNTTKKYILTTHPVTPKRIKLSKKTSKKHKRKYYNPIQNIQHLKINNPIANIKKTIKSNGKYITFENTEISLELPKNANTKQQYLTRVSIETPQGKMTIHSSKGKNIGRIIKSQYFRYHFNNDLIKDIENAKTQRTQIGNSKIDNEKIYINYKTTKQGTIIITYTNRKLRNTSYQILNNFNAANNTTLTAISTHNLALRTYENITKKNIEQINKYFPQLLGHTLGIINFEAFNKNKIDNQKLLYYIE